MKRKSLLDFLIALAIGFLIGDVLQAYLKQKRCLPELIRARLESKAKLRFQPSNFDLQEAPEVDFGISNSQSSSEENNFDRIRQEIGGKRKKRVFIAIHSTPDYLLTRGQAIKDTWLQEIDPRIATVRFISSPVPGFPTLTLPGVDDYAYPPQKKSFKLYAYFNSIADDYDWFIRVDDDLHLQFDLLIQFLNKINPDEPHYIGGTGFGRNADDYIPHGTAFCMGGSGVIFSHKLIRNLRPYLTTCIKNLMTEHEDVEVGRCIWTHLNMDCTKSYETNAILHQNWKKHVAPGEIGYKNDIDAELDLDDKILRSAITLHAVKNPSSQISVRMRILRHRGELMFNRTQELQKMIKSSHGRMKEQMNGCIWDYVKNIDTKYTTSLFSLDPIPQLKLVEPFLTAIRQLKYVKKDMTLNHMLYQCVTSDMKAYLRSFYELSRWHLTMFSQKISSSSFFREPTPLKIDLEKKAQRSVTLIVPLFGRMDNFKRFLGVFKTLTETDDDLNLIVSLSGTPEERFSLIDVIQSILPTTSYQRAVKVITCNIPFKKADCLQKGIDLLKGEDLFFVYDVDLIIDQEVTETNGFWRTWGVGPVAMTKKTYDSSDRYNQTISGWGNEDTELYENFITKKIKFSRSRDAGIFHPWHAKNCEGLPKETTQYSACVKVNLEHRMNLKKMGDIHLKNSNKFLEFLETDQMIVSPPMPINRKKAVLLLTFGKSGDDFIGEIFNSHEEAFYIHEPLHPLYKLGFKSSSVIPRLNLLGNQLSCNFEDQYDQRLSWAKYSQDITADQKLDQHGNFPFRSKHRKLCAPPFCHLDLSDDLKKCESVCPPANVEQLKSSCEPLVTVAKVIRFVEIEKIKSMAVRMNLDLKIMFLTRDPRGILESRLTKTTGNFGPLVATDDKINSMDFVCKHTEKILSQIQNDPWLSSRSHIIRYEDFVMNRGIETTQILRHSGLGSDSKSSSNSAVAKIQQMCESPMRRLGYLPVTFRPTSTELGGNDNIDSFSFEGNTYLV
ncbi:Oidioi.mRNA.OKI2018_I69.chr2.g4611.t1.cds [Oikopleura dioica]|uniref:Hexosyltransferase n=1 Tax=Oikopleura dioica TaxID=34765 RepID=A0ABN7SXZ2_OIKDI|nr:Oidioi.mRNA.OKI2018_I69.chr2.g4611.t1.cds [Oikopleura dioica]